MTPPFDPAVDWPTNLPATVYAPVPIEMAAREIVMQTFPVAYGMCLVEKWLRQAVELTGRDLLQEMMKAMIASDHFRSRIICPPDLTKPSLQPYLEARRNSALAAMPIVLALRAVLDCIPVHWIPEERIAEQTERKLRSMGMEAQIQVETLIPPSPGGNVWTRKASAQDLNALAASIPEAPQAAVLHWPGETRAVVVVRDLNGVVHAFVPQWGAQGKVIPHGQDGLAGATMLPQAEPPVGWTDRVTRWVGLRGAIWRARRRRKLRKGLA